MITSFDAFKRYLRQKDVIPFAFSVTTAVIRSALCFTIPRRSLISGVITFCSRKLWKLMLICDKLHNSDASFRVTGAAILSSEAVLTLFYIKCGGSVATI
ncbi:hypothetical protein L596_021970 [Steinernema carpocapsae]|uniref:Uncharacterized protein n=1 Tax=Steinernema carpocapsae TaxID=34508 RepID=A0A4U5MKF6_STECR|nr:hypothetical protein L596_021970 [Steinernema carpocapsae]